MHFATRSVLRFTEMWSLILYMGIWFKDGAYPMRRIETSSHRESASSFAPSSSQGCAFYVLGWPNLCKSRRFTRTQSTSTVNGFHFPPGGESGNLAWKCNLRKQDRDAAGSTSIESIGRTSRDRSYNWKPGNSWAAQVEPWRLASIWKNPSTPLVQTDMGIQEVVMSRTATVFCGEDEIRWSQLVHLVSTIRFD